MSGGTETETWQLRTAMGYSILDKTVDEAFLTRFLLKELMIDAIINMSSDNLYLDMITNISLTHAEVISRVREWKKQQ